MSQVHYYGTGRRKTAAARVFLRPGSGEMRVNDRPVDDYFPNDVLKMVMISPEDGDEDHGGVSGGFGWFAFGWIGWTVRGSVGWSERMIASPGTAVTVTPSPAPAWRVMSAASSSMNPESSSRTLDPGDVDTIGQEPATIVLPLWGCPVGPCRR